MRKKVLVVATVKPVAGNLPVYFSWWDVDDPSFTPPHDPYDSPSGASGPDNYGIDARLSTDNAVTDGDGDVCDRERLNPNNKDLFVQGTGFGGDFPDFAYGSAFAEAGIAAHDFSGTVGTDDRNIDVLVVTAVNGTYQGYSGHIGRRGPPDGDGRRDWYWSNMGSSLVGNENTYGGGTCVYKISVNYRFSDKPFVDGYTLQTSDWTGSPNGVLDPVGRVEDADDDGQMDGIENDGDTNPPHDNADGDLDGDQPIPSGSAWEYDRDLNPHDIDNDGEIELPLAIQVPANPSNEYTKAHVVMHTITHEIGHAIGCSPFVNWDYHCDDPTCLMYRFTNNYTRQGHLCGACRGAIWIHNN